MPKWCLRWKIFGLVVKVKKINHQAEHGCTRALPRSPLPAWRVPLVAGVALLPGKPTRGPGRPRAGLGPGR